MRGECVRVCMRVRMCVRACVCVHRCMSKRASGGRGNKPPGKTSDGGHNRHTGWMTNLVIEFSFVPLALRLRKFSKTLLSFLPGMEW